MVLEPTSRLELLGPGRTVDVAGRELAIASRKGTPDRPLVRFEGVEDREAAERLRGQAITVARSALGPLAEGEFLVDDLVGCEVFDGARRLGRVADVLAMPSADVLEVDRNSEDTLLVPLVADAVRSIEPEAGRIEIDVSFLDAD